MSKRHKHSKWLYKIVIPSLSICAFAVVIYIYMELSVLTTIRQTKENHILRRMHEMVIWYIRFQQKVLLVPITWMQ